MGEIKASTNPLARFVSVVAHPFVMMVVMVSAATARHGSQGEVVRNVCIVAGFCVLPGLLLMVAQVRRGAWASVDASNPLERRVLYAVGITATAGLVLFFHH